MKLIVLIALLGLSLAIPMPEDNPEPNGTPDADNASTGVCGPPIYHLGAPPHLNYANPQQWSTLF